MKYSVLYLLSLFVIAGCGNPGPSEAEVHRDVMTTPEVAILPLDTSAIVQIIKAETSEPKGTHTFNQAIIRVNGKISKYSISQDAQGSNNLYVRLKVNDNPQYFADCYFTDNNLQNMKSLNLGDELKVKGKCDHAYSDRASLSACKIENDSSINISGIEKPYGQENQPATIDNTAATPAEVNSLDIQKPDSTVIASPSEASLNQVTETSEFNTDSKVQAIGKPVKSTRSYLFFVSLSCIVFGLTSLSSFEFKVGCASMFIGVVLLIILVTSLIMSLL